MTNRAPGPPPVEIELKLALPGSDPAGLLRQLRKTAPLARRKTVHSVLHNVYFDTPEQTLRRARIALRLRRTGDADAATWLQTLKIGGSSDSALSRRGEWEAPVAAAALNAAQLAATPWSALDPDGALFAALTPCFETSFERTAWQVRRADGSVVEVALDLGQVRAGGRSLPICELELELKAGEAGALFELARQIGQSVPLLPANRSKSERGYALAENAAFQPMRPHPPALAPGLALPELAQRVLREMYCQFSTNLDALRSADDPELVHQARVGWRRLRSTWRLFAHVPGLAPAPSWEPLRPLLDLLGELRDLDVARTDTLPALARAYTLGDAVRTGQWQAMEQMLAQRAAQQRDAVRRALAQPLPGLTLLATTQWLESLVQHPEPARGAHPAPAKRWARRRLSKVHERLCEALQQTGDPERLHRVRILAKRLRYAVDALHPLLNAQPARRWLRLATRLQNRLGAVRDQLRAAELVGAMVPDSALANFLRGVAVGRQAARSPLAASRRR